MIFNTVPPLADIIPQGAGAHNAIYRGKYLGSEVTDDQWAAISAGTFDDLYIGDYWTIGGVNYRIAAFDYYLNTGDTKCTEHHIVIVPDSALYTAAMNAQATNATGYLGSDMRTKNLDKAKTTIDTAFAGHVLSHREYLVNAVSNGISSGSVFADCEIELMSEPMVFGSYVFSAGSSANSIPYNYRIEKGQLPVFFHNPVLATIGSNYWLRDTIFTDRFSFVNAYGNSDYGRAPNVYGVRPVFCLC